MFEHYVPGPSLLQRVLPMGVNDFLTSVAIFAGIVVVTYFFFAIFVLSRPY